MMAPTPADEKAKREALGGIIPKGVKKEDDEDDA
tara:strand:+ start:334 stop:435 length:102 start_codon:yes stop_codon:yes gene_type:complete